MSIMMSEAEVVQLEKDLHAAVLATKHQVSEVVAAWACAKFVLGIVDDQPTRVILDAEILRHRIQGSIQLSTEKEIAAVTRVLATDRNLCEPGVTIIELGAYGGEDSQFMREAVNNTHQINVMVEPDRRNCEIIRRDRRGVNTVIVEAAIADYTGLIEFHAAADWRTDGERSGSGSIRKPTKHQELFLGY